MTAFRFSHFLIFLATLIDLLLGMVPVQKI